jgi:hypothetical protein
MSRAASARAAALVVAFAESSAAFAVKPASQTAHIATSRTSSRCNACSFKARPKTTLLVLSEETLRVR